MTASDIEHQQKVLMFDAMNEEIEETSPAGWMPIAMLTWDDCSIRAWQQSFNELAYRLFHTLVESNDPLTYTQARYLVLIAEQVRFLYQVGIR